MPIREAMQERYPPDWKVISRRIRTERAAGRCECSGQCGTAHQGEPGAEARCAARNTEAHPVTGSKVVLTVAHLNHTPEDCRDENLLAMCQRCHLRYDAEEHRKNAAATRRAQLRNLELFNP